MTTGLATDPANLLGDRAERVGALSREHQLLWLGATLLLGEAWQRPLARLVHNGDRYVRRVASGEHPVPRAWLEAIVRGLDWRRDVEAGVMRELLARLGVTPQP